MAQVYRRVTDPRIVPGAPACAIDAP